MAEAPPTITANDYFNASTHAAKLKPQNSSTEETNDFYEVIDATGDYACSGEFNHGDAYMTEYRYCKGVTADLDTDLGVFLSAFGDLPSGASGIIETMRIDFVAGEAPTITINGHQHDGDQAHVNGTLDTFDVAAASIIPNLTGDGVPDLITVSGTVSAASASLEISANHIDKIGADGVHFWGQNVGPCRVDLTVNYEGHASSPTAGNWLDIKIALSGPNQETPTSSLTAHQFVARS